MFDISSLAVKDTTIVELETPTGDELLNDAGLTPERRAKVNQALSDLGDEANQAYIATERAAHLATLRNHSTGSDAREPLATMTAGGEHHAVGAENRTVTVWRSFALSVQVRRDAQSRRDDFRRCGQ